LARRRRSAHDLLRHGYIVAAAHDPARTISGGEEIQRTTMQFCVTCLLIISSFAT